MYNPNLKFFCSHQFRQHAVSINSHTHNCYELVYFHKGSGSLLINEKSYTITPGLIYIVYPNTPHSEMHFADGDVSFLGFDCPDFSKSRLKEIPYDILKHQLICRLMEMIMQEASEQNENYSELISHMLAEITLLLERYSSSAEQTVKSLDYISAYISEYYNQTINFKHLAKLSGYSPDHFRHVFVKEMGVSPKQFQINKRLEKSAEFLSDSKKSCTEIAYLCGFSNSAQFSKMFCNKYGISPSEFRRKNQ